MERNKIDIKAEAMWSEEKLVCAIRLILFCLDSKQKPNDEIYNGKVRGKMQKFHVAALN